MKTIFILALLTFVLAGCTPHVSTPIQHIKIVTLDRDTKEPVPYAVVIIKNKKSTTINAWTGESASSNKKKRAIVTDEKGELTIRGFTTIGLSGPSSDFITLIDFAYSADSWKSGSAVRDGNTYTVYLEKEENAKSRLPRAERDLYESDEPVKKFRNKRERGLFFAIYENDMKLTTYKYNMEEYETLLSLINKGSRLAWCN